MIWLRILIQRLRGLFLKRRLERELEEEIRSHLEMQIEDDVRQGMSPEEARRAARRKFGGVAQIKEIYRDRSDLPLVESTLQDLRYAARMLAKNPSFTLIAVITLALGIGANTAIFSLIDAVLLRMLPVSQPEQLVIVNTVQTTRIDNQYSYPVYEQVRDQQRSFAGIFAAGFVDRLNITRHVPGAIAEVELVDGELVSGSYFSVLGVKPIVGRAFTMEDDRTPGGHPVAVISYRYWQQRWAGDPAVVGQTFTLNGATFNIIGVAPPEFFGESVGQAPDIWIPMMMTPQFHPGRNGLTERGYTWVRIIARLKRGVSLQQAQADLNLIFRRMQSEEDTSNWSPQYRQEYISQKIMLTPGGKGFSELRQRFSLPLRILMVVVGLVLLIACANIANLLLTRATARQKEIAVRVALGASRQRLIRQLLTESALLAFVGGALGLLFAYWSSGVLLALVSTGTYSIPLDISPDLRIFTFTGTVSMLTAILFGLAPALRAARVDLTPALRNTVRGSGGGTANYGFVTWGKLLIIMQVVLSLLLLIGAGLFIRTIQNLEYQDIGFNREQVLVAKIDSGATNYKGAQLRSLYQKLFERLNALPGVRSSSFAFQIFPGGGSSICCISIKGAPPLSEKDRSVKAGYVGPKYFETMGTPLLQGRDFDQGDNDNAQQVAVISEAASRYYFPNESPIGKRFVWVKKEIEIVGVVKDAKYDGLREPAPRLFYLPVFQSGWANFVAVRTIGDPTGIITALRRELQAIDPKLAVFEITTLSEQVDASIIQERLLATLLSFFGLLALLLSCIGIYGIMSYTVTQRTAEIGIRLALGAQQRDVLRLVVRQGMAPALVGLGVGLIGAFALTRLMKDLLFDVRADDPATFAFVALLLAAAALLACYIPARRAAKVDPIIALRSE